VSRLTTASLGCNANDMNEQAVAEAIEAALPAVALLEAFPPYAHPDSDLAIVSRLTDVGIQDEAAFRHLVATLASEPELRALEGKQFTASLGFFIGPIHVESLAKSILAQVLNGRNVFELLRSLSQFLQRNSSEVLIIIAVSGIEVIERAELGGDVEIIPVHVLPPSIPRGVALGQDPPGVNANYAQNPYPMRTALACRVMVSPIIVSEEEQKAARDQHLIIYNEALNHLSETMNCLALVDLLPIVARIGWQHFADPGAFFVGSSGWTIWDPQTLTQSRGLEIHRSQTLCGAYFRIPQERRERVLRIPLDRLHRVLRQGSIVDKAIDLGIALEALLLHDIKSTEQLGFRLRLRGSLLLGGDLETRHQQMRSLRDVYVLRSTAVHQGRLEETERNRVTLNEGLRICAKLLHLLIDRGGEVDFTTLELGNPPDMERHIPPLPDDVGT
jgi:hypothetical protein